MGKLEKEVKKEIRATKIQKVVLQTIAGAGLISVSLLAPNALKALRMFGLSGRTLQNKRRGINNSRIRLVEMGLVKYSSNGMLCLTDKGIKQLEKFERSNYKINKPVKWDGKWRVLIFDIQEKKRTLRDKIRATLNHIGFIKLQNSVWVYPYDCEDLITLLKADFGIGREVLYLIVDRIENDKFLRKYFKLGS